MKAIAIALCILMLTMAPVSAQEAGPDPGITPDSFLYGLDVALDQISLLLTFDRGAKARKGLKIAEERLLEVREMAEENKLEAMERAQREHSNALGTVTSAVRGLERANSTEEIEDEIEIEKELEEHRTKIEMIRGELKVKIKIKGNVTAEQQAMIDSILGSLENQTGKVKIEIDNKKGRTKTKIKIETGKSDAEIEDEVEDIERKKGLTRMRLEWAQKAIDHAEEKIAKAQEKIDEKRAEGVNVTIAEDYLAQANTLLAQAKDALNASEYRDARKLAKEAGKLAMHAKRGKSFVEIEETKVKAEVVGNVTQAKVKVEFMSTTTEREILASEILDKLKLDKETISNLLKIEIGKEKELIERLRAEVKIKEGISKVKAKFEFTLNTTNRDEIVDGTYEKLSALTIEDITDENAGVLEIKVEERELEIEAEIEDAQTTVEVEIDGEEMEFTLDTTNRGEIVSEIASRTGLTAEEVEGVIKFKEKKVHPGRQRFEVGNESERVREEIEEGRKPSEEREEKAEIKAEIKDDQTTVEVEIDGEEMEFTLDTTNRGEIVSEIASRTGLTAEEVEGVIKFKEKKKHEETSGTEEVGNETISVPESVEEVGEVSTENETAELPRETVELEPTENETAPEA